LEERREGTGLSSALAYTRPVSSVSAFLWGLSGMFVAPQKSPLANCEKVGFLSSGG